MQYPKQNKSSKRKVKNMMKTWKKFAGLLLALVMVLGLATNSFAQTVDSGKGGTGTINISNAAKGETYAVYKLFGATLGTNGAIAYTGTVPTGLTAYFEETSTGSGYVQATKAAFRTITYYTDAAMGTTSATETAYWKGSEMSDGLKNALTTWKNSATAVASVVSDGSALEFTKLELGYYVVTTSQGEQAISVDSTQPNVTIKDKNTTTITVTKKVNGKDEDSVSIGETVTYTADFVTANYRGDKQVQSYTISDTLPEFLKDVKITGLKIVQSASDKTTYSDVDLSSSYTAFSNKKIVIPWVDDNGANLYKNGSIIQLTYTAEITSTVNINGANTNTISIQPNEDKGGEKPFEEPYTDTAVVKTYGVALKKVDENNNELAGAVFTIAGLTVEAVEGEAGVYRVVSYDKDSTTASAELNTNTDGKLYIVGLKDGVTLKVTEAKAPDGYNKLTETVDLPTQVLTKTIYETSGTRYYDAKGNLVKEEASSSTSATVEKNYTELDEKAVTVVNHSGALLPSTGGMGTTILYVAGGILVLLAAVLLITKKRVDAKN